MILNPNCSEEVTRLEVKLDVRKLTDAEIETMISIIEEQTNEFELETKPNVIVIYDFDEFGRVENDLSNMPFWNKVEYNEHEFTVMV